jgi:predicted dienelactone hydrolase
MRKFISIITALVIGLIAIAPAAAQTQVLLPALTGTYAVGRVTYDFVDAARQDPFLTDSKPSRELSVKVYYPADVAQRAASTPYVEVVEVDVLAMTLHLPTDVVQSDLRAYAVTDAPLSAAALTFPVVLFSGDISGTALYYTSLLEDIASHGYIVAAISHPYSNQFAVLSDGRVAFAVESANPGAAKSAAGRDQVGAVWTADMQFMLSQLELLNRSDNRFAGHLDLANVAVIGHQNTQ